MGKQWRQEQKQYYIRDKDIAENWARSSEFNTYMFRFRMPIAGKGAYTSVQN